MALIKRDKCILTMISLIIILSSCHMQTGKTTVGNTHYSKEDFFKMSRIKEEPEFITCSTSLQNLTDSTCTVTTGNNNLLIQGNILTAYTVYLGGEILITNDGYISCVGCQCLNTDMAEHATKITCPQGVVSPAMINAHDHINYNQSFPIKQSFERYDHRNDWRKGCRNHTKLIFKSNKNNFKIIWSELRQVMSGTTSVAGSGGNKGLLRNFNLYNTELQEWPSHINPLSIDYDVFPLGDADGTELETSCDYYNIKQHKITSDTLASDCFMPHIAEGVDLVANNEFKCLSGQATGGIKLIGKKSSLIHTIALRADDAKLLSDTETSVVWSPRSNISLYGTTAPITMYFNLRNIPIALGTDWTFSGSMNILRELKCADYLNKYYLDNFFSDYVLWLMPTLGSALALNIVDRAGTIWPGNVADIAIFKGSDAPNPYRAIIEAGVEDTVLVLKAGKPLYGDSHIIRSIPFGNDQCESMGEVCSIPKHVCIKRETGYTYDELKENNRDSYPLYFCKSQIPDNEPSCVPERIIDGKTCGNYPLYENNIDYDQDGVLDVNDNCPFIFNPVRPLDGAYYYAQSECRQADCDGDGQGDACDPSPLGLSGICNYPELPSRHGNVCRNKN